MAISYVAQGAIDKGGSSINVPYPSVPDGVAGQYLFVLCVSSRMHETDTPAGWTAQYNAESGSGSFGADSGVDATAQIFTLEGDGTETGTVTVTRSPTTDLYVLEGVILCYEKDSPSGWFLQAGGDGDTTVGTSWSVLVDAAGFDFADGDVVVAVSAPNTANRTYSAEDLTAPGMTYDTAVERMDDVASGSGIHVGLVVSEHTNITGSDVSDADHTFVMTASGSAGSEPAGPTVLLWISVEAETPIVTVDTATHDFPIVSVWENIGSEYALVGSIMVYDSLMYEPRFLEAGTWEMTMPYSGTALSVRADRLYTVDWREARTTWCLDRYTPSSNAESGPSLTVGGPSALSILGRELAWPRPTLALNLQDPNSPSPPVAGANAETVVRNVVEANYITRRGDLLALETNTNLGGAVQAHPKFDNLLEFVTRKARHGGIGVDINLVNTTSTRAVLTLQIWEPADKTLQVRLSEKIGNLLGWEQNNTAPTLTRAIVSGPGGGVEQIYKEVDTPESIQAAAEWGGHRVTLVDGPASYDDPDLIQAGEEALKEGAQVTNVALEAADTSGLQAFRDYNVGDKVTAQLFTGLDIEDVISSINVTVNDGYPEITPTFGNPNAKEPMVEMAELVRRMSRRIRLLEQRS